MPKKNGQNFQSDIVILGIWPHNILRNLSVFKYYLTGASFQSKPRIIFEKNKLQVINSPVTNHNNLISVLLEPSNNSLLKYDYWYDLENTKERTLYNLHSFRVFCSFKAHCNRVEKIKKIYSGELPDGINITVTIAEQFSKEVLAKGSIPLILIIPTRDQPDLYEKGRPYQLVQTLKDKNINFIDLGPSLGSEIKEAKLTGEGVSKYYVDYSHHRPYGNQRMAHYIKSDITPWIQEAKNKKLKLNN